MSKVIGASRSISTVRQAKSPTANLTMDGSRGFFGVYKTWRNRTHKFSAESIVRMAMQGLQQPIASKLEDMRRAPWLTMLLVKWVCQDKMMDHGVGAPITMQEFDDLRQELWDFPEQLGSSLTETLPGQLFFRQLINPQIGFQREFSPGFVRESAMLLRQPSNSTLRQMFEEKTGMGLADFLDLGFATYTAILDGKRRFDLSWFESLLPIYSNSKITAFLNCISRTVPELRKYCQALPNARERTRSELFEFPVLTRYPFLRTGRTLECWHPAVFYRGMEGFVHAILSESGDDYMDRFSKLFERHVVEEARKMSARFLTEDDMRTWMPSGAKSPDGLLSFPGCNVFIESKAGIFDPSVMCIGHAERFAHKTKALQKATSQAWSASVLLRDERRAPPSVLDATRDYLLIVTNKELSASRGTSLAAMYPPDTLTPIDPRATHFLPLENIYVLSIEDFERLAAGTANLQIDLPRFLDDCVEADKAAETSVFYFEQHLHRCKVPRQYSELVTQTLGNMAGRLERAFASEAI